MKLIFYFHIREQFNPSIYHKIAILFNLKQKSMKQLSSADLKLVLDFRVGRSYLCRQCWETTPQDNPSRSLASKLTTSTTMLQWKKTSWPLTGTMLFLQDHTLISSVGGDNAVTFPGMARLAKSILSIMATSAPSERNFSHAKSSTERHIDRQHFAVEQCSAVITTNKIHFLYWTLFNSFVFHVHGL